MKKSMKTSKEHALGTRAIHAGQSPDPSTGAIMTPIHASSINVLRVMDGDRIVGIL
jgi:cystathionine gamma-lyase